MLENLKDFSKKENKIFTALLLIFLAIFTGSSFLGYIFPWIFLLYIPFLYCCVIIFALAFFFGKDLREDLTLKTFLVAFIISVVITTIFLSLVIWLLVIFIILAIVAYIFITTTFISWNVYNFSIKCDLTLHQVDSRVLSTMSRILLFIPSLIVIVVTFGAMFLFPLFIPLWIVLIAILVIAIIYSLIKNRFYAWLGPFYLWLFVYNIYLLITALLGLLGGGFGLSPFSIVLYIFDLIFIVYIISNIIGDKAQWTKRQLNKVPLLRRANPDSIIMLLFISKITLEFLGFFPELYIEIIKNLITFILFIPLILILAIIGLRKYNQKIDKLEGQKSQKEEDNSLKLET